MKKLAGVVLGLTVGACAAACSDSEIVVPPDALALGDGRFLLQVSNQTITLERDGLPVVTLDPQSFQIGVVHTLGTNLSWDPWEIEQRGEAAAGVTFLSPSTWAPSIDSDGDAIIRLDYGGGIGADLAIAVASGSRFSLTLSPDDPQPGQPPVALARVRVRTSGDPAEGFYGLGEQLDTVDNRGKLRPMQLEVDDASESKTNDAHAPVPLLVGTHGWAMFVATQRVGAFDVAKKDPNVVEATFAVAGTDDGVRADSLRVDLFLADSPLDLYAEYYQASSLVHAPPPWALGPWVWRATNKNQAEVEADIAAIRTLDLPISGLWINQPYERFVNTFDFDPARFPDPLGLVEHAHGSGLQLTLASTPYLEKTAEPLFDDVTNHGYFPRQIGKTFNPFGPPLDFTSPDASAYWRVLIQHFTTLGVDGFKLDYGEDIVPSIGSQRNAWGFSDGADERTMHHRFSGLYHRVYSDAASGREPQAPPTNNPLPFLFVRGAHWGDHELGVVLSSGPMDATFTAHQESFASREGPTVTGIGGLPTTVVMGLSLAASGFSFFASDTGGYLHGPADKELFVRWVEQTALSTVMELGDATGQPPWQETPQNGRDAEALGIFRAYARLHTQLFPYVWTYAQRMLQDGRPIQRPLGLAYPALGRHPADEYLFGDDLLVAPVLARGQTSRSALVPPGTWFGFWDAVPAAGDAQNGVQLDAPLGTLPLLVREGAIIPMLRPTIDTLATATDPAVESFGRDPGPLWAFIVPGPPRAFDLWDGAHLEREAPGTFVVGDGGIFAHGFVLQLIATDEPSSVLREGTALPRLDSLDALNAAGSGWTWTSDRRGTVFVKLPSGDARVVVH